VSISIDGLDGDARRGRPRSAATTRAVLDATIDLLSEEGYGRVSIERIAARSNVAKSAIYRRWCSKAVLVAEALAAGERPETDPDTGDLADDLVLYLSRGWTGARVGRRRIAVRVLAEAHGDPELVEAIRSRVVEPRRAGLLRILRRGEARGDVARGIDVELLAEVLVAPLLKAMLLDHGRTIAGDFPQRIVDLVLGGASASPRKR